MSNRKWKYFDKTGFGDLCGKTIEEIEFYGGDDIGLFFTDNSCVVMRYDNDDGFTLLAERDIQNSMVAVFIGIRSEEEVRKNQIRWRMYDRRQKLRLLQHDLANDEQDAKGLKICPKCVEGYQDDSMSPCQECNGTGKWEKKFGE